MREHHHVPLRVRGLGLGELAKLRKLPANPSHLAVEVDVGPGRLRRALDTGNATIALAAAAELEFVSLPDALELVLLLVDEPGRFRRAALRWHARYCGDVPDVGFEEAQAVLACLAGLTGRRPNAAASALAELVNRRGLERASQVLFRWAR